MQLRRQRQSLNLKVKPSFFLLMGFFLIPSAVGIATDSWSEKWEHLSIVGALGLTFIVYAFVEKFYLATHGMKLMLVVGLGFAFFALQSMILAQ